ncbi:MAG TPA: amidohydrolase family protein [Chloroflexota bacterium]|jgi:dihydroorotase-like cyclic amidohydrolase
MAESCDLVLVGGPVVTPGGIVDGGVAVRNGRITAIGGARDLPPAARTIDLRGRALLPGVIDPECHLGSHRPLAADVESETHAAAATGVTTWGLQLNSAMMAPPPGGIQAPDQIPSMADAVPHLLATESLATVDFFLSPIITTDAQVGEIPMLAREYGITSFKFHLQMAGPWGHQPAGPQPAYNFDDGTVFAACEAIAALGPPARVLYHCENWQIARMLQQRLQAAGRTDMGAWDDHSPWLTEAAHARAYLYFCEVTGCPAYVVHCTTEQTIAEVQRARQAGVDVYSQVGVHYLVLDKDAWRINVPLRDRATHPALWHALASGAIDCVGSDHVAHNRPRAAMETGNVWTTISGFPSRVEGLLPMLLSEGVNAGRLSLERLAQVASETPARIFGLYPRKGVIQVGADADLLVVDLEREATVHAGMLHTATPWTIYEGRHVKGWPVMTLLRGEVVMEWPDDAPKAEIVGPPRGRYLRRPLGAPA